LADDIDVITRILGLIEDAGIAGYEIYFNDFDLFRFFIDSLDMSPGTAGKIRTCFEQATDIDDFRRRAKPRPFTLPDGVMLTGNNDMVAGRSMTEIKDRLAQKQLDTERSAEDADKVERLTAFLRFFSTPVSWNKLPEQFPEMQDYVQTRTRNLGESLIPEIANIMSGFDLDRLFFSPAFGRKMAYYTGLSFEIHVPRLGPRRVIAAGGRYDDLLFSLGAPTDTPAVGGAVSLERLQEAATTQASIEATIEGASS
jgi:ATP phosphoribosyltransferase regulatory subunit HisZ